MPDNVPPTLADILTDEQYAYVKQNIQEVVLEATRLDRSDLATHFRERAEAHRHDLLTTDLPRLIEGLTAGYPDDKLGLYVHDVLVRIRNLKYIAAEIENR